MLKPEKLSQRQQTIDELESFYCERLSQLIDQDEFDDAHSIYQEFVIDHQEPDSYVFIEIQKQ